MKKVLIFGATGFLGDEICQLLENSGWRVTRFGYRSSREKVFSSKTPDWAIDLGSTGPFDAVVWAQGVNASGTILSTTKEGLQEVLEANLFFIFDTLKSLFASSLLAHESRGVVISSIWEENVRGNKFSYIVSKSALRGLVGSVTTDLAMDGFTLNSILPGVIDSPMTKANLSRESISRIQRETPGGKLVTANEIANLVLFLISKSSTGISGQSIVADNGWSRVHHVDD